MAGVRLSVKSSGGNLDNMARRLANVRPVAMQIAQFGLRHSRDRLRNRIKHPQRSTGKLLRSGHSQVEGDKTAYVGYAAIYAAIQHKGGVIVAKKKFLALPVPDSLAKSGVWPKQFPKGSLKFVRRAKITLLGRSWTGPALVAHSEKMQEEADTKKGAIMRRVSKKEKRTGRKVSATSLLGLRMRVIELRLQRRRVKDARNAKFGEVLFALVRKVKVPGEKWLTWDGIWRKFSADALRRHMGLSV